MTRIILAALLLSYTEFAPTPYVLTKTCVATKTEYRRVCDENTHGWGGCVAGFLLGGRIGCVAGAVIGSNTNTPTCYDKAFESCAAEQWVHTQHPLYFSKTVKP